MGPIRKPRTPSSALVARKFSKDFSARARSLRSAGNSQPCSLQNAASPMPSRRRELAFVLAGEPPGRGGGRRAGVEGGQLPREADPARQQRDDQQEYPGSGDRAGDDGGGHEPSVRQAATVSGALTAAPPTSGPASSRSGASKRASLRSQKKPAA